MKKALLLIAVAMFTLVTFGQSKAKSTPKKENNSIDKKASERTRSLNAITKLTPKQRTSIYTIHYNFISRNKEIRANKSLSEAKRKELIQKSNAERWKMIKSELKKEQLEKLRLARYQQKIDAASTTEDK